jgi:hypothetical protein
MFDTHNLLSTTAYLPLVKYQKSAHPSLGLKPFRWDFNHLIALMLNPNYRTRKEYAPFLPITNVWGFLAQF